MSERAPEDPQENRSGTGSPGGGAEPEPDQSELEGRSEQHGETPDVYLNVPVLKVDEINLDVEDLRARVSLQAEVLDLLKLNVGVDAHLGHVGLEINGVEAEALLKVRLDNVAAILDRVLKTIDRNPQILEHITRGVESAARSVGEGAGEAVRQVGHGAGEAVEEVGEGAGGAVDQIGRGTGEAVQDVGEGAGEAVQDVGEGAGEAVQDVGEGAGEAAQDVGRSTGEAVSSTGEQHGTRSAGGKEQEAGEPRRRRTSKRSGTASGNRESPRRPRPREGGENA
ncbi:hypothetical protein [Bounagaea algeriensis]